MYMNLQELFSADFGETLLRFVLCLIVNWGIVNYLYYKKSRRRDFYFTFMIISVAIYFLVYLMMGMDRGKATGCMSRTKSSHRAPGCPGGSVPACTCGWTGWSRCLRS